MTSSKEVCVFIFFSICLCYGQQNQTVFDFETSQSSLNYSLPQLETLPATQQLPVSEPEQSASVPTFSSSVGTYSDETSPTFTPKTNLTTLSLESLNSLLLCQKCSCGSRDIIPFKVNCSHRHLQDTFRDSDWPKDILISSIEVSFISNDLHEIRQFTNLPITKLILKDNKIALIEKAAFKNLNKLEHLDLSKNSLTESSLNKDTFEGFFNQKDYEPLPLKTLRLGYNDIGAFDKDDVFDHLSHLERLELNNNPIETIKHETAVALASLKKLKYLNLAETKISSIPEGLFHALPNLKTLILTGNLFSVTPSELKNAVHLESLNLNNNPIQKLDNESFQGLSKLLRLNLSSMGNLTKIGPNTFTPLSSLETLWCSYNLLLSFISPSAFANMDYIDRSLSIKEFYFRENNVRYIAPFLLPWSSMDTIDVQGNPFVCDCHASWIINELLPLIEEKNQDLTLNLACAEPPELKGRKLYSLVNDKAIVSCSGNVSFDEVTGYPIRLPTNFLEKRSNSGAIMLSILGLALLVGGVACLVLFMTFKKTNLRRLYDTGSGQIVHYVRTAGGNSKEDEQVIVEKEFTQYNPDP